MRFNVGFNRAPSATIRILEAYLPGPNRSPTDLNPAPLSHVSKPCADLSLSLSLSLSLPSADYELKIFAWEPHLILIRTYAALGGGGEVCLRCRLKREIITVDILSRDVGVTERERESERGRGCGFTGDRC